MGEKIKGENPEGSCVDQLAISKIDTKMKIPRLECQFFPNLRYMSKLVHYPVVQIEACENYTKGSYRNRCYLATSLGIQLLSVPLKKGKNQQQSIREVKIDYAQNWQQQYWQAIRTAYGSAPYYEHYEDQIRGLFEKQHENLFDWNLEIINTFIQLINIDCQLDLTAEFEKEPTDPVIDLRNHIHPKAHRRKPDLYFTEPKYAQVFMEKTGFLPNLSVLDLVFCTGPQALVILDRSFVK